MSRFFDEGQQTIVFEDFFDGHSEEEEEIQEGTIGPFSLDSETAISGETIWVDADPQLTPPEVKTARQAERCEQKRGGASH